MRYPLIFAACLALAACGTTQQQQQLSVAALCTTYGKSLKELANYRTRLDAKAVAVVEEVRAALNPMCLAPTPPSATDAATQVAMASLGRLSTIIALAKE